MGNSKTKSFGNHLREKSMMKKVKMNEDKAKLDRESKEWRDQESKFLEDEYFKNLVAEIKNSAARMVDNGLDSCTVRLRDIESNASSFHIDYFDIVKRRLPSVASDLDLNLNVVFIDNDGYIYVSL